MPHDPKVLLEDVRLAARDIQDFVRNRSFVDYENDRLLRAGVERLFILIGEALSRLDKLNPHVTARITDFRKVIDFRNVLVHGYESIDHSIVWKTVEGHLPILIAEVEVLIASP